MCAPFSFCCCYCLQVSADALNYQLEFHNAHSNFQFDRYHQFSKEVESYKGLVTMVTNQLSTMLEKVTSSGENSSIKQKLAAIIHDLEMAYDSLKQLCSEMEANSKYYQHREQWLFYHNGLPMNKLMFTSISIC